MTNVTKTTEKTIAAAEASVCVRRMLLKFDFNQVA